MVVTYKEYNEKKRAFFEKHNNEFENRTSPMNEYGVYHKEYIFKDGAMWCEVMMPTYEKIVTDVVVKGVNCKIENEIKMLKTEFYTNEFGSYSYYEKW